MLWSFKKIFGDFKYVKFDILKDKIQSKFDYIFSLSTFYLFNDKELEKILININNILNKDGILILEFPGSEDNLTSFIFHEIFLVMEVYIIYYLSKLLNKKIGFTIDNNFGYRRKNKEIEKFAKKYGFQLIEIKEYDYLEELKRSIFIEKIIKHFPKSKKIFSFFGKQIPYVRMFKFKKEWSIWEKILLK